MSSSASVRNMRAATPGATAFPHRRGRPSRSVISSIWSGPMASAQLPRTRRGVVLRQSRNRPPSTSRLEDHVDVPHARRTSKIAAAVPASRASPPTTTSSGDGWPGRSAARAPRCRRPRSPTLRKVVRAWIGALVAGDLDRAEQHQPLAPDAISSISSYDTRSSLRASGTIRGSAVNTLDVRVDLARRAERRRERHGGRVGAHDRASSRPSCRARSPGSRRRARCARGRAPRARAPA